MNANLEPQLHNQCVSFVLYNMSEVPAQDSVVSYVQNQVNEYFNSLGWQMPSIVLPDYPSDFNNVNLYSWINNWVANSGASQELQSYLTQLVDIVMAEPAFDEFYTTLRNLVSSAEDTLSQDELQAFVNSLNIGQNSLSYWLGNHDGQHIWTAGLLTEPPANSAAINWWKVGGCDLVGAGGGFLMAGPKGALVGGAVSSLCSIINQW